jgi:hypothetical protein
LVIAGISFVRSTPRPGRPDGKAESWKLAVWLVISFAGLFAIVVASHYPQVHRHAP